MNGTDEASLSPHRLLAGDRPAGLVLESHRPVYECLDFRLSRRFWHLRGTDAFVGGDVPYVVTNDGHLAANGVATFLASLDDGQDSWNILEIGAGSGLFARQFMDQLREASPDVYARTRYHATDGSEGMVQSWADTGVFDDHEGRILGQVAELPGLPGALSDGLRFQAAFANYILDSLPFTLLAHLGPKVWELELQTALDAEVDASRYVSMTEDEIAACIGREDLDALVDLYPALVLDARYRETDRAALPMAETLPPDTGADQAQASPYLHCYGALQTLREITALLGQGGFLAIADYGHDLTPGEQDVFEFQHFGGSVAIGLNFEAIDRVCPQWQGISVVGPEADNGQLLMRLVHKGAQPQVEEMFLRKAGKENWDRLTQPLTAAHELTSNGQYEAARWKYGEALRLQPHNWAVIEEAAGFLTYRLDDFEAGLRMAQAGIARNPLSPGLWNIAGDCLFYSDHLAEAEEAYARANAVSPRDIRSLLNLAWVAVATGRDDEALALIARGLAIDHTDDFREALLAKQAEILEARRGRRQRDMLRSINRIRGHRNLPRQQ